MRGFSNFRGELFRGKKPSRSLLFSGLPETAVFSRRSKVVIWRLRQICLERKCPPPRPHLQRTFTKEEWGKEHPAFSAGTVVVLVLSSRLSYRGSLSQKRPVGEGLAPPARSLFADLRRGGEQTTVILSGAEGGVEGSPHRNAQQTVGEGTFRLAEITPPV